MAFKSKKVPLLLSAHVALGKSPKRIRESQRGSGFADSVFPEKKAKRERERERETAADGRRFDDDDARDSTHKRNERR